MQLEVSLVDTYLACVISMAISLLHVILLQHGFITPAMQKRGQETGALKMVQLVSVKYLIYTKTS